MLYSNFLGMVRSS